MLVSIWQWNQWIDFLPANGVFISHTESQTWLRDSSQTLAPLSLVGFWALPPKFHAVQLFAKKGKHVKKGTWFLTRRKGCSSYCLGQSETTCNPSTIHVIESYCHLADTIPAVWVDCSMQWFAQEKNADISLEIKYEEPKELKIQKIEVPCRFRNKWPAFKGWSTTHNFQVGIYMYIIFKFLGCGNSFARCFQSLFDIVINILCLCIHIFFRDT